MQNSDASATAPTGSAALEAFREAAANYAGDRIVVEQGSSGDHSVSFSSNNARLIHTLGDCYETYGFSVRQSSTARESFGCDLSTHTLEVQRALNEAGLSLFRQGLEVAGPAKRAFGKQFTTVRDHLHSSTRETEPGRLTSPGQKPLWGL